MKPPIVHQPVQPPQPVKPLDSGDDAVQPFDEVAADDGRDVRYESTTGRTPGLVGDFGPLVDTPRPDFDLAPDQEQERRRH